MNRFLWAIVWLGVAVGSAGAQNFGAGRFYLAAPFVDETTAAALRIDLDKLDVDVALKAFGKLLPGPVNADAGDVERRFAKLVDLAKRLQSELRALGGREVFVLLNLSDDPTQGPAIVVPLAKDADRDRALKVFAEFKMVESRVLHGCLVAGMPLAVQQAEKRTPKASPGFAAAFEATVEHPHQIVVLPPEVLRKSVEELMPDLPKWAGGGSVQRFTQGIRWLAAGVDLGADPKLAFTLQARDETSAKELHANAQTAISFAQAAGLVGGKEMDALARVLRSAKLTQRSDRITWAPPVPDVVKSLESALGNVQEASSRSMSMNNLRQIGLAFHMHLDANKGLFPAHAIYDKAMKKPLLSWRVAILPHIEQKPLYDRFKLDEPWDSPHNKALIPLMPRVYRSPFAKVESGKTTYVLATGPKLLFGTAKAKGIRDVVDGTSNTILAFDVDDASAVTWTKPDDWEYDPKAPTRGLFRGANPLPAVFCDGSARLIAARTPPERFFLWFCPSDGQVIPND